LGEVLTHDIFKQSQEELYGNLHEDKKKIVVLMTKTSNDDDHDCDSEASTADDVTLMVKKFRRFLKNKGNQSGSSKSGRSYSKNPFAKKKCFQCGEMGYISTNCKNKYEDNSSKKKKFEGRKKLFKKYSKKKMARLVMLSGTRMQVQIPTLMLMRMMRNAPRRVSPVLPSRRLHIYLTHLIVLRQKANLRYAKLMSSLMMILLRW
jgi:hypothetical protein